tara:strand:- start:434 stop:556 length:123 start_codon:yes stop_codon:yes gene_type:complete
MKTIAKSLAIAVVAILGIAVSYGVTVIIITVVSGNYFLAI